MLNLAIRKPSRQRIVIEKLHKMRSFMTKLLCAVVAPLVIVGTPAQAKPVIDCPLRDVPFSLESPLLDLMLSERAKVIIARQVPGFFEKMPASLTNTDVPNFSAIMTLRQLLALAGLNGADPASLDTALRALPVTLADKRARCSRYDDERPRFTQPPGYPRVLLFEKITGYRDTPSVLAADKMFRELAEKNGWSLVVTDKAGVFHRSTLHRFDVVIWNNNSGDVLTIAQRKAFRNYVESGGGYVGIHGAAGDPAYFWDWYPDELIGARFVGHPSNPHFQDAKIAIESHEGGVGLGIDAQWTMNDEWYSFASSPRLRGASIVATIDEASYQPSGADKKETHLIMGADHPVAWTRAVGKGRSFYSAIGHRPETYDDLNYRRLLEQAVNWSARSAAPPP